MGDPIQVAGNRLSIALAALFAAGLVTVLGYALLGGTPPPPRFPALFEPVFWTGFLSLLALGALDMLWRGWRRVRDGKWPPRETARLPSAGVGMIQSAGGVLLLASGAIHRMLGDGSLRFSLGLSLAGTAVLGLGIALGTVERRREAALPRRFWIVFWPLAGIAGLLMLIQWRVREYGWATLRDDLTPLLCVAILSGFVALIRRCLR